MNTKITPPLILLVVLFAVCMFAMPYSSAYAQTKTESSDQAERVIKGSIKDAAGVPLAGAAIIIKGTSVGTMADAKGSFSIKVKPTSVLMVSFMGYVTQNITVGTKTTINIVLKESTTDVEDVVVIGYGSVKKSDLTGSVSNVKMADVDGVPVMSIDQALQGRIAGADIMSTTGEPGAKTSIRIRGTRSITAGNEPLLVVDGVLDAVSDLGDINPSDIESVTVLKDASSTAIYGARGSNGVIMVTTKKGRMGKPSVQFRTDMGFSQLPKGLDIMNATEFALYRNDYAYFSTTDNNGEIGPGTPMSEYPYPDPYSLGKGTDWIDQITRNGMYQNYNISVSGGTAKSTYFASFGYTDTQGIIKNSGEGRYTGRFNVTHSFHEKFKAGLMLNYTHREKNNNKAEISGNSWWQAAMYLNPNLKPDSNFNDLWYEGSKFNSPLANIALKSDYTTRVSLTNTAFAELELIKGLKIRSQVSVYSYKTEDFDYSPSTMPANASEEGGYAARSSSNSLSILSENTVNYEKKINNKHNINALLGYTAQKWNEDKLGLSGRGYLVDDLLWNSMQSIPDKLNLSPSSSNTEKRRMSLLARFNYNYDQRYYVTFTARADGAMNFASDHKWGVFPSGAVKWNAHAEKFMKNVKWIDELAVRASAGRTGNDAISSYRSLATMGSTVSGYLFGASQPVAYYPSRIASPNLTWETTDMYNVAIDAAFLKSRLKVTAEVYYSKTTDLLLDVQRPSHTGYTSRFMNIGQTSNKGFELTIESRNISNKDFSWTTSFTMSHNSQNVDNIATEKQVAVYNSFNTGNMMYGYVKDYPLNALWGYNYAGTWKNQAEIDRNAITKTYVSTSKSLYSPGSPRYLDMDHSGTINERDLVYMGNADPWLYGGIQNTFQYKGFTLGVYFNYSLGGKIYNIAEQFMGNNSTYTNQYRYMLNSWHPVRNPESNVPRAGSLDYIPSDRMIHDATFLRLKNVSLGYTLNTAKWTKDAVRDVTFSVNCDNVYLWKKYNGFDPEVSTSSENSALRRLDAGAYPKPRTITFSIQLRY